ncbi:MAG: FAD-binding oxidoreductase [Alphaproteobacteria bacterium]|nr:FAD-binding oxidoreductase [Alphaproteobacteria bacterium]
MDAKLFTEDFKITPYWWEAAPPRKINDPLPETADVVIVGGGYAGLSTALELARNGTKAVVLEAEDFGHGASSRNGGGVSGTNVGKGPTAGAISPVEKALGKQRMQELLAGGAEALSNLEAMIEREKLECHWVRCGRFVGAYTPAHFDTMVEKVASLNAAGDYGAALLTKDEQRREIATDFYFGGMTIEGSGSVHPAMLQMALLDRCIEQGVTLCAHTTMQAISADGDGHLVATSAGIIKAREVVVGTNGYTGKATGWLRRRLIPAASYMIATEERGEDEIKALIPNNRTMADSKRVLNYYRLAPGGRRVLFGGRARLALGDPRECAPILYRQMLDVWPQLEGIKVSHCWTGGIAFTFDFLPHMGRHNGVHFMAGCNGAGVAMMTYLGTQTALKILDKANRPCPFDELPFNSRPGYTGHPWFLPIVSGYYALRDRMDRARAA